MIGIYKITSKNNPELFYVGKSNDIERRLEILELCSVDELSEKEQYWVNKLQATSSGNIFDGGLTDVVGEHNPKSKLTEEDIIYIRQAYNEHKKQKEIYEKFKDIISFNHFQNIWQGRVWAHVMPEVFTEENKKYYIYENSRGSNSNLSSFTDEEII